MAGFLWGEFGWREALGAGYSVRIARCFTFLSCRRVAGVEKRAAFSTGGGVQIFV